MNVSAPFIVRPIATTLLTVGVALLGLVAYLVLPIAGVPQVDIPTIQVLALLPGASAETMATSVAAPLERQLALISGVTSISSASSLGRTAIQVEFDLGRSIDAAAQDVQTAINAAGGQLPKNLPNPPTYEKVNPADAQLMSIAVTSDDLPISTVDEYVENYLAVQLSRVTGVGVVDFHGEQKPAIRVQVNPTAVSALGLSLEDVRSALATATVNAPKGTLDGPKQSLTLDATDQLFDAATFNSVIVAYRNGAPVRVGDIGTALDGVEDIRQAAWLGGRRAVIIDVHKQPGYNINQTVVLVKQALVELQRNLPPSIKVDVLGDRTQTIRTSVSDVQFTMAISVGLVVLVVFLFLRRASVTLIPSITIPISLLSTCAVMLLLGYTIDNVSLMALTISVGFIIDDAIVMVENIVRHTEAGERPLAAALKGAREVGFTILAMTLSLTAVFIPLLLMGGLIGRLFREFAVTASVAILMSGLVSLSLTPMMCGQLLHTTGHQRKGRIDAALEAAFDGALRRYATGLAWALRHRLFMVAVMLGTLAATCYLYVVIPKGFFPQQDNGTITGTTEAAQDISYSAMVARVHEMAKIVMADPDVGTVYYWVGANPTVNTGRMMIDLKPFSQRRASATDVLARLRKAARRVPGIALFGQPRQDVQIGAR
ncbi:MAG: efflux RND transporter permease subunit, partial [Methylobacteriaceae bacterium]|nr:efflux RND transporter permease subunit [Methylobacteriaceae bacterium]